MFCDKLKRYRNYLGLTQEEFSKVTGISRSIIGQLESNQRLPSKNVLIKLSQHSGKSMDYWLGIEEATAPEAKIVCKELEALNSIINYMIDAGLLEEGQKIPQKELEHLIKILELEIQNKIKNRGVK